jgi:hypothetical protein
MANYMVTLDEPQDEAAAVDTFYPDEVPTDEVLLDEVLTDEAPLDGMPPDELPTPEAGDDVAVCAHCGDLLAWHEQACGPTAVPVVAEEAVIYRPASTYAFEMGLAVQPVASVQGQIIWRGQIKERQADSGLVLRVNVYGLNNGFWDCYREEELQAA